MPNDETCETCGGERVLIGDKADSRGERTDDVQPCPDCTTDEDCGDSDCDGCRSSREFELAWSAHRCINAGRFVGDRRAS